MSVNFPASGGSSSNERVMPSEAILKLKETAADHASSANAQAVPLSISSMSDIKQAELRGDNYTVSDEQLVRAIEKAVNALQGKTTSLEFTIHQQTKRIAVKVKDASTGEVIREIPPEKTLDYLAKLWEMAGLIIDEKR